MIYVYFKAKKCKFKKLKIEYLGLVIEEGKLTMDPTKLEGIMNWPAPKTVKEVRSFIGFGNFYHCFINMSYLGKKSGSDELKK
jgi:hypothetical protein